MFDDSRGAIKENDWIDAHRLLIDLPNSIEAGRYWKRSRRKKFKDVEMLGSEWWEPTISTQSRNTNEGALCCRLPLFSFCSCFYILPSHFLIYRDWVCVRACRIYTHTHTHTWIGALSSQSIWPTKVLLLSCVCTYRETTLFNADARRRANNAHTQTLEQKRVH